MTWVAVAIGGSAALGAGASYLGSKKQAQGAQNAANLNMDMFRTLNQQQQPFIQSGYGAMGRLNTLLGLNPSPAAQTAPMPNEGGGMDPRIQQILQARTGSPTSRMFQRVLSESQGQGGSPGYMPTPGGGVQPIMQTGGSQPVHDTFAGGPGGDPRGGGGNVHLRQLLALRAQHGDTQAARMLGLV